MGPTMDNAWITGVKTRGVIGSLDIAEFCNAVGTETDPAQRVGWILEAMIARHIADAEYLNP